MNRIFKTVWNVARRALVVVNEKAGIGQSRCAAKGEVSDSVESSAARAIKEKQKNDFGVPSGLVMALAGVLVLCGGNAEAAKTFPTDCASVGGTMKGGVCYRTEVEGWSTAINDDWILETGDFIIQASTGVNGLTYIANGDSDTAGRLINNGKGTISILGPNESSGHAIFAIGYDNEGSICNNGIGSVVIKGGDAYASYGIASASDGNVFSVATIANSGDGRLEIVGGKGKYSYGIVTVAENGTSIITNTGSGVLAICSGVGEQAHGIKFLSRSANASVLNGVSGTINLFGNSEKNSFAIERLSYLSGEAKIDNRGTLNLGENAIGVFGESATVYNRSEGTVNAEVQVMFERDDRSSSENLGVNLLNPKDGQNGDTLIPGFNENNSEIWELKDDWAKHSVWEEGGTLNITDVVEGSLAAQQITTTFTKLFGTGTTLNFLGEDDWASDGISSSADSFTASIGNSLIDQGYAGNIVTNFNLNNASSDGTAQPLTIGTGEGEVIKDSLGFRQVEGVSFVTVNSGKYFALIGLPAGGELIKGGAPVTLDNGMLMLGVTPAESARTDSSTAGTLETVTMKNGSKIETENMWVQVASVEGQGNVSLTETGRMHVGNMNVKGNVKNDGTLSADS